jgi:hypothetical protein
MGAYANLDDDEMMEELNMLESQEKIPLPSPPQHEIGHNVVAHDSNEEVKDNLRAQNRQSSEQIS